VPHRKLLRLLHGDGRGKEFGRRFEQSMEMGRTPASRPPPIFPVVLATPTCAEHCPTPIRQSPVPARPAVTKDWETCRIDRAALTYPGGGILFHSSAPCSSISSRLNWSAQPGRRVLSARQIEVGHLGARQNDGLRMPVRHVLVGADERAGKMTPAAGLKMAIGSFAGYAGGGANDTAFPAVRP
jgi:hypothetical protein